MHTRHLHLTQHEPLSRAPYAALEETTRVGRPELLPDAVLPEQFYGPPRGASHAQSGLALRRAVLDDAIHCYQKQFVTSSQHEQRLAKEAEAWFFDNDEQWPFSFVNVCRALGFEPEYLRRGLKRWHRHPLAEQQRRRRHAIPPRQLVRVAA